MLLYVHCKECINSYTKNYTLNRGKKCFEMKCIEEQEGFPDKTKFKCYLSLSVIAVNSKINV